LQKEWWKVVMAFSDERDSDDTVSGNEIEAQIADRIRNSFP
jgi:hypothetical protein